MMDKLGWWADMIQNKTMYEELQRRDNKIRELGRWILEVRNGLADDESSSKMRYGMLRGVDMVKDQMEAMGLIQED